MTPVALSPTADPAEVAAPAVRPQLGEVYRQHASFVWRCLASMGVAEDAREDLVHEVFLVVRRKLPDFDPQRSVRGWLHGISRNAALHHMRATGRRQRRMELVRPPDAPTEPEERLRWAEGARQMEAFLDELDDDKRDAFFMAEIEGMTAPEIAEATGVNLATIYSRIRAARQRFETYVERLHATRRSG